MIRIDFDTQYLVYLVWRYCTHNNAVRYRSLGIVLLQARLRLVKS